MSRHKLIIDATSLLIVVFALFPLSRMESVEGVYASAG